MVEHIELLCEGVLNNSAHTFVFVEPLYRCDSRESWVYILVSWFRADVYSDSCVSRWFNHTNFLWDLSEGCTMSAIYRRVMFPVSLTYCVLFSAGMFRSLNYSERIIDELDLTVFRVCSTSLGRLQDRVVETWSIWRRCFMLYST